MKLPKIFIVSDFYKIVNYASVGWSFRQRQRNLKLPELAVWLPDLLAHLLPLVSSEPGLRELHNLNSGDYPGQVAALLSLNILQGDKF